MRSSLSGKLLAALVPGVALVAIASASATSSGCSTNVDSGDKSDSIAAFEVNGDSRVQVVDVRDDAGRSSALCGDEQLCDPDIAAICTPLAPDAGTPDTSTSADAPAADAADAADASDADTSEPLDAADALDGEPPDTSGAGTTAACRVVKRMNKSIAACAPAGKLLESEFCSSDDECAPGLTCVGVLGRCLRYCCKAWGAVADVPDAGGGTHFCTPKPLTARPSERVPVWVKLDNCTLLDDALQCLEGTTCTVVTNDGRTTCVLAGTGRDYAPCGEEACDRGYVCLGTNERVCRKLCRESEGATACPNGGYCQRVPTIPEGYGVCTGGDAGAK